MLRISQLGGFGSGGGGGTDVTPGPIDFDNISDVSTFPAVSTNIVTITGIDATITLRLTLTSAMSGSRIVSVYRAGAFAGSGSSGTTLDVTITNGQTLMYSFLNYTNLSTWTGTATVSNLSDGGATLDTFTYTLQDTGTDIVADAVVTL